jgi:hypothetical protein
MNNEVINIPYKMISDKNIGDTELYCYAHIVSNNYKNYIIGGKTVNAKTVLAKKSQPT